MKCWMRWGSAMILRIISAHRTPQRLADFATGTAEEGVKVIIAGAGGAAHLWDDYSFTHLPVLSVPVKSKALNGMVHCYPLCRCLPVLPLARWLLARQEQKIPGC